MKYNWDDISDYVAGLSIEDVKIKYGLKNVIK